MHGILFLTIVNMARRPGESGGCGSFGCILAILVIGLVVFLVMKGRKDKPELLGASKRPMNSGPLQPHTFACPFPKCPNCAAASDKMKQQWDGLRKVTWTCGYCGNVQIQELKDEELPPSARQRLGLDPSAQMMPGQQGYYPQGGGSGMGGVGGLLTGMMIGNMLGGSHHGHRDNDGGWGSGGDSGSSSGGDWGDSGGSSDSGGDSGGDWGGGDSGGDSGGDW
jgi:hypothetical protein